MVDKIMFSVNQGLSKDYCWKAHWDTKFNVCPNVRKCTLGHECPQNTQIDLASVQSDQFSLSNIAFRCNWRSKISSDGYWKLWSNCIDALPDLSQGGQVHLCHVRLNSWWFLRPLQSSNVNLSYIWHILQYPINREVVGNVRLSRSALFERFSLLESEINS